MPATTDYAIYISGSRGNMQLPVNPEEYRIEYPDDHENYNVLGIGEVIQPRKPGLRVISWEGLLPDSGEAFEVSGEVDPEDFIENIEAYLKGGDKEIVQFIASRTNERGYLFDTNIKCVVTNFSHREVGGEPGDFYYEIELTEYRTYAAQTVALIPATNNAVKADATPQRDTGGAISVGDNVIANGTYYYTSYGDSPTGKATNLRTTVTRIVGSPQSNQRYPYHIGHYGWLTLGQLTKV